MARPWARMRVRVRVGIRWRFYHLGRLDNRRILGVAGVCCGFADMGCGTGAVAPGLQGTGALKGAMRGARGGSGITGCAWIRRASVISPPLQHARSPLAQPPPPQHTGVWLQRKRGAPHADSVPGERML